jgi:hypothetical protein
VVIGDARVGIINADSVGTVLVERALWWRVYSNAYRTCAFNTSTTGNARFSPLYDSKGIIVPTMYLGQTPAIALMETVLHDCPYPSSGYILTLPNEKKEIRRMGCLAVLEPLLLADFSAIGLRRIGLKKSQIIESEKTKYSFTRSLASQIYSLRPDVQGIQWTSKQDDRASVVILFEPRISSHKIIAWHEDLHINDGIVLDELVDLLDKLDAGLTLSGY